MSQWTHVIGTIQCDKEDKFVVKALGKPVLWSDSDELEYGTPEYEDYDENVWKKAFEENRKGRGIPMGSEGSINYKITSTLEENDYAGEGTLVAIEGDLRDYGGEKDVDFIIDWFTRGARELHARAAVLSIDDEWSDQFVVVYWDFGRVRVNYFPKEIENV